MRLNRRLGLLLLVVVGLSACGDDDPTDPDDGPPAGGLMTATVDGNPWSAVQIAAVNSSGSIAISGSDASLLALGFAFVGNTTGTYAIGTGSTSSANVIDNLTTTWSANAFQGSGTITVSTLTATRAAGTFSYTATLTSGTGTPATRVVTNGRFDVSF